MKLILILAISSFIGVLDSSAQRKKAPPLEYDVSFVHVGARSDAYWVGKGEKMDVKAYDPGAAPPKGLVVATSKKSKTSPTKERKQELRPALNVPSERITVATNVCKLQKKRFAEEKAYYTPYTSIELPQAAGPYTALIARKVKAKNWDTPQQLVLSDSLEVFPEGAVRIANLSDRTLLIQIAGKSYATLKPGKTKMIKNILSLEKSVKLSLIYMHKKKPGMAFKRLLRFPSNQRKTIVCTYVPKKSKPIAASMLATQPVVDHSPVE